MHKWKLVVASILACCLFSLPAARAQDDVTVYEYEPYAVKLWYCFDSSVTATAISKETFLRDVQWGLEATFAAAWRTKLEPLPGSLVTPVVRGFQSVNIAQLSQGDFVLALSTENEKSKTLRTVDASLDALAEFPIATADYDALKSKAERFPADSPLKKMLAKAKPADLSVDDVRSGNHPCVLLRQSAIDDTTGLRVLPTNLPGQIDSLLRTADKLFLMVVSQKGDTYTVKAREIDCPMRYVGPSMSHTASSWPSLARDATAVLSRAFAPVARVEDANSSSAKLLLKAGGLITSENNPAAIQVGDVMHPIVRRDNRNGVPTLLEPQSWTFAAITKVQREDLDANVYSYSGGPGLTGRKNARTQRVLLRVRPVESVTEIEVVVRGTQEPQSGCFVYRRDLLTDQFVFLGRTDWRGRLSIEVPAEMPRILPAEVKRNRLAAMREFDAQKADENVADSPPEGDAPPEDVASSENALAKQVEADAKAKIAAALDTEQYEIPLRAGLLQLYVKSGEFVLGKLAMVPGLKAVEVAGLADDTRRLEIEAFVRGFQVEIIDLIGLRNVLAARIKLHVKNGRVDEANKSLERLVSLENYEEMANRLVVIQRKFLDDAQEDIPSYSKLKVDRMFTVTRQLLQKYLQDGLVEASRQRIDSAGDAEVEAEVTQ